MALLGNRALAIGLTLLYIIGSLYSRGQVWYHYVRSPATEHFSPVLLGFSCLLILMLLAAMLFCLRGDRRAFLSASVLLVIDAITELFLTLEAADGGAVSWRAVVGPGAMLIAAYFCWRGAYDG